MTIASVLLYPGAGSDRDHSSLLAIEHRLGRRAHVDRIDFPYRREGRRAPDRAPKLMASMRNDLTTVARRRGPVVLGGRSMGGRMASMIAAERMTDGSVIINISSPAGDRGVPGSGHYAAAKAGVNSLTKTLSLELAPAIRVNGISPGFVPTEVMMTALSTDEEALEKMAQKRIPLRRLGTPNDMGSTAVYLASDAGSWMTGQTLIVAGGL